MAGTITPVGSKRLSAQNSLFEKESNKHITEMRKISNTVLKVYDKDIEMMRDKYNQLMNEKITSVDHPTQPKPSATRLRARSEVSPTTPAPEPTLFTYNLTKPDGVSTNRSLRSGSLKLKDTRNSTPTKPTLSRMNSVPSRPNPGTTFPRGKSITKKKKKASLSSPDRSPRVSHSYCEAVVYNEVSKESTVVQRSSDIQLPDRRISTSMFDTVKGGSFIPSDLLEEEEEDPSVSSEEGGGPREGGTGGEGDGPREGGTGGTPGATAASLNQALMKMGDDCPYKDLLS